MELLKVDTLEIAKEKLKKHGSYREIDVIEQLQKDFHGKCYLCEIHR